MNYALVGRISCEIQLFYNDNNKTIHYNCNIIILLRRELWTLSYLVFWNFAKYLRKVFETSLNGYTCNHSQNIWDKL